MQIPILMYHMVKNKLTEPEKKIHVSKKTFETQIKALAKKGFKPVTLIDLYNAFTHGDSLPVKPIIITFDDGYLDNFEVAFPILKKYDFTATIFLPTDLIDNDRHNFFNKHPLMNWDEVREMYKSGISFASHTATHPHLTKLSNEKLIHELTSSKESLEKYFVEKCNFIAYPYGDFDSKVRDLTERAGYLGACSVKFGLNKASDDLFSLKRIAIIDLDNLSRFLRKITFGVWDAPWAIFPRYYLKRVSEKIRS